MDVRPQKLIYYNNNFHYDNNEKTPNDDNIYFHRRKSSLSDTELSKYVDDFSDVGSESHYKNNHNNNYKDEVNYRLTSLHQVMSKNNACNGRYVGSEMALEEDNTYYNPHYISRTPSSGSSGAPSSLDQPVQPHYYEIQPRGAPTLLPLDMVDREIHSRRVSALMLNDPLKKLSSAKPRVKESSSWQRRFSIIGSNESQNHNGMFRKNSQDSERKDHFTFSKKSAQKLIKRTKLSTITGALSSELSQSASALYSLFTGNENNVAKPQKHWQSSTSQIYSTPETPLSPVATVTREPRFLAGSHLNDAANISVKLASQARKFSVPTHYAVGNAGIERDSVHYYDSSSLTNNESSISNLRTDHAYVIQPLKSSIKSTAVVPRNDPKHLNPVGSLFSLQLSNNIDSDEVTPRPEDTATYLSSSHSVVTLPVNYSAFQTAGSSKSSSFPQLTSPICNKAAHFDRSALPPLPGSRDLDGWSDQSLECCCSQLVSHSQQQQDVHAPNCKLSTEPVFAETGMPALKQQHRAALHAVADAHATRGIKPVSVTKFSVAMAQQAIIDYMV